MADLFACYDCEDKGTISIRIGVAHYAGRLVPILAETPCPYCQIREQMAIAQARRAMQAVSNG
jgi:hypothetical protein